MNTTGFDADHQVILALVALATAMVTLLGLMIRRGVVAAKGAEHHARAANLAVNNVETGEESLYRRVSLLDRKVDWLVDQQREFDRRWGNLPADVDDAVGLVTVLHDVQAAVARIEHDLAEHIDWEMTEKYKETHP